MPNSFASEADNGVIIAAGPNPEAFHPHVFLHLSHVSGPEDKPVVLVARLNPEDARAIGAALVASAERVQPRYDEYIAEINADGTLGE